MVAVPGLVAALSLLERLVEADRLRPRRPRQQPIGHDRRDRFRSPFSPQVAARSTTRNAWSSKGRGWRGDASPPSGAPRTYPARSPWRLGTPHRAPRRGARYEATLSGLAILFVPDDLWAATASLISPASPRSMGGRPHVPDRTALGGGGAAPRALGRPGHEVLADAARLTGTRLLGRAAQGATGPVRGGGEVRPKGRQGRRGNCAIRPIVAIRAPSGT